MSADVHLEPTVEILDVSPALAGTWLAKNPNNRNLRRAVADVYARDMLAGDWMLNGEAIAAFRVRMVKMRVGGGRQRNCSPSAARQRLERTPIR